MSRTPILFAALVGLFARSGSVVAACSHTDFLHDLAKRESNLNTGAINPYGYIGAFQMGEAALQDAGYYKGDLTSTNDWSGSWTGRGGVNTKADFLARPDTQVQAVVAFHDTLVAQIRQAGLDRYIGATIGGVQVTMSGLVAGSHLVGMGNLKSFLNSAGSTIPRDGNGVPITTYIAELGGCAIDASTPSYAAVVAAAGGAGVGTAPTVPPATGMPTAPSPIAVDPSTAFAMASGQPPAALKQAVSAIVATLLTLWLAWTAQSIFFAWWRRRLSFHAMQADIVRGCIVLCLMLVILQ